MILKKIHRAISFTQGRVFEKFVNVNNTMRKESTSNADKDLFKFFANSVYGKTLQNFRDYRQIRLVSNDKQAKRLLAKPNMARFQKISDNLSMIELTNTTAHYRQITQVAFTILELSKLHMVEFIYDFIKPQYGDRANVLLSDTDSALLVVNTPDIYRDMSINLNAYDTSDFDINHICYSEKNKKALGLFKDEFPRHVISEYVGLSSKIYSLSLNDNTTKRKCKGVKRSYVKEKLKHEVYKQVLLNETIVNSEFHAIRSFNHTLKTVKINKVALTPLDEKFFIRRGEFINIPFGHYKLLPSKL